MSLYTASTVAAADMWSQLGAVVGARASSANAFAKIAV